ncbi:uncharacterized protein LOC111643756 [Copidosoma floridanum]|uniref:uncharacterized protein LOC111643756 n=1 Tax=Copidosoma floridanum TaxID=29053 RepID=UPI000C6FA0F9|nr:uncharacterized protein LOC111643756 [Copidosoma floridanum]
MAAEISTRQVDKFNGTNFRLWKFQLQNLFVANGIDGVVTGDRVKPEDLTTADGKAWVKEDAKAKFVMSSTMDQEQIDHVLTCTTAKEMWDRLVTIHEQNSATHKLLLIQRFHEYRMDSGDSVAAHVTKVTNMARQLKDLDEGVTEVMIIAKILAGLPTKFRGFRSAWNSVDPTRQTVEYLQQRLLEEESLMEADGEEKNALSATIRKSDKKDTGEKSKRGPRLKSSRKNMGNATRLPALNYKKLKNRKPMVKTNLTVFSVSLDDLSTGVGVLKSDITNIRDTIMVGYQEVVANQLDDLSTGVGVLKSDITNIRDTIMVGYQEVRRKSEITNNLVLQGLKTKSGNCPEVIHNLIHQKLKLNVDLAEIT